jgi:aminoglycoside phosphotransferase (APT) family kinase protein
LLSLRDSGEFFLLTGYTDGEPYAGDLWTVARQKALAPRDVTRCDCLADYLASLHNEKVNRPGAYRRAIRDLIGHGEGIFGLVDNYPGDVPAAPLPRLQAIERLCLDWRFRLRGRESRLCRTHGDFHPFNILFDKDNHLGVLDASRGCLGDPADDMTCLSINYVFFALEHSGSWKAAFSKLWRSLWKNYLDRTSDYELLEAAPPYLAWRALVLCNPLWYPNARIETREALLGLVEQALRKGRFHLEDVERLFP